MEIQSLSTLEPWLIDRIAKVLDKPASSIDPNQRFELLGLDSVSSMELIAALEEKLKKELPPTVALDYPTIRELSRYLEA
jgi:acyl carrier protein